MITKKLLENLTALSKLRGNSEIILYLTSTKPEPYFRTLIASDSLPLFGEILKKLGKQRKISLYLYSMGGFLETPWPLVNLIREFCDEFEVIIPDKALSAATLISLGADRIVMTPFSLLSPVDPSGELPMGEKTKRNIQIEDIAGFINFTKERYGIKKQELLIESLKILSEEIPPTFLGSINRTQNLIGSLTERLLDLHNQKLSKEIRDKVVNKMTKDLFAHNHFINRREAKEEIGLGSIIHYASEAEEKLINSIFDLYKRRMQLDRTFNIQGFLGDSPERTLTLNRLIIESRVMTYTLMSKYKVSKNEDRYNILDTSSTWEKSTHKKEVNK